MVGPKEGDWVEERNRGKEVANLMSALRGSLLCYRSLSFFSYYPFSCLLLPLLSFRHASLLCYVLSSFRGLDHSWARSHVRQRSMFVIARSGCVRWPWIAFRFCCIRWRSSVPSVCIRKP